MRASGSILLTVFLFLLLSVPTLVVSDSGTPSSTVLSQTSRIVQSGVSNGHVLINKTFFEPSDQAAAAVIQRDDGGFVIGGYHGNALGDGLILLGADANGNHEWNETYGPGAALRRLVECNDGGFALLGMILPEGSEYDDWFVVRTNSSHGLQWNQTYGGLGYDYPSGIVELEDGFMLGGSWTNVSGANLDYMLIRTDINGTALWNVTFGGSEDEWCRQMIGCSDGGFLLCGFTSVDKSDIWLVKTDSSGGHVWNRTYGTGEYDKAHDVIELQEGGYAVTGGISDGNDGVLLLLRIDSEGDQLWNRTYARVANRTFDAYSVIETPDQGFCLRARETVLLTIDTYWLVRTDCNGSMLWEYALGAQSIRVYSVINADGGGFITVGTAGEYGTDKWDVHLMLFPELSWIEEPVDQLWFTNVIPIPSYQLNATSAAPIQSWQVNDTHFSIDNQGLMTNATCLNGTYYLDITVRDSVDNTLTANMIIHATMKTLPTTTMTTTHPAFPVELLVSASIGAIVLMIAAAYLVKMRKR